MDFLGLRNLTILDDALENIVMNGKDPVELERSRSTTARRTSCWAGVTRSVCSSSTAAACGRCCG